MLCPIFSRSCSTSLSASPHSPYKTGPLAPPRTFRPSSTSSSKLTRQASLFNLTLISKPPKAWCPWVVCSSPSSTYNSRPVLHLKTRRSASAVSGGKQRSGLMIPSAASNIGLATTLNYPKRQRRNTAHLLNISSPSSRPKS